MTYMSTIVSPIRRDLETLQKRFDVVIVGGGITGISTAREAALRGLSVCLIEKNDFASATSAATSKLIHGGLRYLENLELTLVRESLKERRLLAGAAGHLVQPLPILLPVYNFTFPGRFLLNVGLKMYDILSFDRNSRIPQVNQMPMTGYVSRNYIESHEYCLRTDELKGGFIFYDYQSIHPERLALAFLKSAVAQGAVAFNHMEAQNFILAGQGSRREAVAVRVVDRLTGKHYEIEGRSFINATGPWMDYLLAATVGRPNQTLNRSQGIHLLTKDICQGRNILHRNKHGRHFFVLSWMGMSLIGPTDTPFIDHPDNIAKHKDDIATLLSDVNDMLPLRMQLQESDILATVIGIRPLVTSKIVGSRGDDPGTYHASRKAEIFDHSTDGVGSLLSVAGGKWTTSRHMGEQVIRKILKKKELRKKARPADSTYLPLPGFPSFGYDPRQLSEEMLSLCEKEGLPADIANTLFRLYGNEVTAILEILRRTEVRTLHKGVNLPVRLLRQRISDKPGPGHDEIMAQVVFAIENESAVTLEDLVNRRLKVGTLGQISKHSVESIAKVMGIMLGWSDRRRKSEVEGYLKKFSGTEIRPYRKGS